MCWSTEVSVATWLMSVCISLYLIRRGALNDLWHAIFLLTFSFVQLLEAFIWMNMESQCRYMLWPTALALGPTMAVGMYVEYKRPCIEFLYVSLCFLIGIASTLLIDQPKSTEVSVGSHGHIVWPYANPLTQAVIVISYIYGALIMIKHMKPYGMIFAAFGLISVLVSSIFLSSGAEFASAWCHIANLYGLMAILLPGVKEKASE